MMNLSKSTNENKPITVTDDREAFIKSEIQKFLQDKKLLTRLEQ